MRDAVVGVITRVSAPAASMSHPSANSPLLRRWATQELRRPAQRTPYFNILWFLPRLAAVVGLTPEHGCWLTFLRRSPRKHPSRPGSCGGVCPLTLRCFEGTEICSNDQI